ncbi:cysteine desulfurase [candidate division WWE3 bacterium CG08_land_8_20_14_0_20_40_13]|uniref:Cysteine desulfurase n=1 Tax=candidate division WWE3 bacterium CG08_land_8_20_14_0_20_40_13 TaxID=1975084 RepID=A0A2H0XDU6_UNCKA|nr:MAG: cysteine desulfurase [candidate division WWE3 bacterium CG08_land_8_20_14_0_20_40_13]
MTENTKTSDFPILACNINNHRLVYLDNAATTQKPKCVIDAVSNFYLKHNANVHRGIHTLSEEATEMLEETRRKVASFIDAVVPEEVIFTSGATDSLNIAARLVEPKVQKNSVIVTTELEHHSNFVPWQELAKKTGAVLKVIPVLSVGSFDYQKTKEILLQKVDIFAITHVSNVTGEVIDVKSLVKIAKAKNPDCLVIVDGAQAVGHMPVNVQSLDCDFYAFSAHKMLGPTGVGVLWIKRDLWDKFNPVKFGGGMISEVSLSKSTWDVAPYKFEAGTPNIAGIVGLGAAVGYLNSIGIEKIYGEIRELTEYALEKLGKLGIKILGAEDTKKRLGVVSFNVPSIHAHDLASVLDSLGIAIRSGHHCAMPLHTALKIPASARASFYLYNTKKDIDELVKGIIKAKEMFRV